MSTNIKSRGRKLRIILGVAAVLASTTFVACKVSGHAEGKTTVKIPFVAPIHVSASIGDAKYKVDGGPAHANKCVKITWSDKTGADIESEIIETDGSGAASGKIPEGAVRWEAKLVDCPEPKPDPKADGGMFAPRSMVVPGMREFIVHGAPLFPDDSAYANNLVYNFKVQAMDWTHAENLIAPIIAGGVGTPVPPGVEVMSFTTTEAGLAGGRVVSAMPGTFESFKLDFNRGAFTADLASGYNTINYRIGSWDVVEMVIPMADFDFGLVPGVLYSNEVKLSFKTDRISEPVTLKQKFSFSN